MASFTSTVTDFPPKCHKLLRMKAAYQLYTTMDGSHQSIHRLPCFQKPLFSLLWPAYLKNAAADLYSLLPCSAKRGISPTGDAAGGPGREILLTHGPGPAPEPCPPALCPQGALFSNRQQDQSSGRPHGLLQNRDRGAHLLEKQLFFIVFFWLYFKSARSPTSCRTFRFGSSVLCPCSPMFDLFPRSFCSKDWDPPSTHRAARWGHARAWVASRPLAGSLCARDSEQAVAGGVVSLRPTPPVWV